MHRMAKHILLLPEDPYECFVHAVTALDLADRLQTPVFVMTDLDIGMNQRLCKPFDWDDERFYERGKVMSAEDLESGKDFGRYKDVDGDGIPWRTLPGTHPTKGSYFTRGTTRDPYARYSEKGSDYMYNMDRLQKKFKSAAQMVPAPEFKEGSKAGSIGVIYYGSTSPAMKEAFDLLEHQGINLNGMRICAFPFSDSVAEFIAQQELIFVVEQNRDAQMRSLLINELEIDPARLIKVLHYDGTPITARFIHSTIFERLSKMQSDQNSQNKIREPA